MASIYCKLHGVWSPRRNRRVDRHLVALLGRDCQRHSGVTSIKATAVVFDKALMACRIPSLLGFKHVGVEVRLLGGGEIAVKRGTFDEVREGAAFGDLVDRVKGEHPPPLSSAIAPTILFRGVSFVVSWCLRELTTVCLLLLLLLSAPFNLIISLLRICEFFF